MKQEVTLRQLRYFIALSETGQYRKAAERVGVSQPSLSQQIAGLEAALDLPLVERGQRGAVLTPGGREVLEHARKVVEETQALQALAQSSREGLSGTVRLGASPTLGPYFLPYVVRRLRRVCPGLKLIIRDAAPDVLQDELLAGRHDLILAQLPLHSRDLISERLFREPLKLAVAQDHPLAAMERVEDRDLLGLDMLRQMTALSMGVSFLPALYVRSEVSKGAGDVAILSFRNDRFTRSVGVAWRRRSAHRALLDRIIPVIRAVVQKHFAQLVIVEG